MQIEDSKDTIAIIYHKNCYDGFGAAAVVAHWCNINDRHYYTVPYAYGDPFPVMEIINRFPVMVDISFSVTDALLKVCSNGGIILDHHKTAEPFCKELLTSGWEGMFDLNRSGVGLAWDFFFPESERPCLVNLIEDRDLWKFKHEDTHAFQAYLSSLFPEVESYLEILQVSDTEEEGVFYEKAIRAGEIILQYKEQWYRKHLDGFRTFKIKTDSYTGDAIICNMQYFDCSEILNSALLVSAAPVAVSWYQKANGQYQFSLRGSGKIDVSQIAEEFGGGGHKDAAGFIVSSLPKEFGFD